MIERTRIFLISVLAIALSVYTVYDVNYGAAPPLAQLAIFAMLGIILCFLVFPLHPRVKDAAALRVVDFIFSLGMAVCCCYLIWEGNELVNLRVGRFTTADYAVAITGTLLILEATRRSIGMALPILAGAFLLYAYGGASLPDWAFAHRGYDVSRITAQCFLGTKGVFGVAMRVMFTYVFLFVVFGAFLEMSGATQFIIDLARRVFGRSPGGPAKVAVLGSGLMGSLSGSAVANAVTTGTFTIPMMRSAGFRPHIAGGITAAAASGGALVPPVMGAGAYMMLEIVPDVTFVQIAKAAIIPAVLYYLSILLIVHFYSGRIGTKADQADQATPLPKFEGMVFFGALGTLIGFLLMGYTPFRSVTYSLEVILLMSIFRPSMKVSMMNRWIALAVFVILTVATGWLRARGNPNLRFGDWAMWADAGIPAMLVLLLAALAHPAWRSMVHEAFVKAAKSGISLVSASACVGIVIGVVSLTGVGTAFPNAIVPLAEQSLLAALVAIMLCSIVLGMGLPSAVCYLLMATLIGPVLNKMGVIPLAAHFFIFYFGMMSMVTPPVALAAYASASIAKSKVMPTAFAAFRFSLVGFTLPYMFIYQPALLLMKRAKNDAGFISVGVSDIPTVVPAVFVAMVGILSLAAGVAGYFKALLSWPARVGFILAAAMLLSPDIFIAGNDVGIYVNLTGGALFIVMAAMNWQRAASEEPDSTTAATST